jgi:hypothetical protein
LLLKNEPLDTVLLQEFSETSGHYSWSAVHDATCRRLNAVLDSLDIVQANAHKLLSKPGELELWRIEKPTISRNAKPWRAYLWEPIFRLMTESELSVPKTTRGPLIRIFATIHDALGLDPLDPESVKKAAEAYRNRVK